jgi:hypothetical protein
MHIADNFSILTSMLLAFGGVLFICGFFFVVSAWGRGKPSDPSFVIPATVLVIGLITAVSGWSWNSSNSEDLNKDFAAQLQTQYGAVSDKSYTDLFKSKDRIATLTKGDEKKQVQVIFENNGDLKFTDISNTPYK